MRAAHLEIVLALGLLETSRDRAGLTTASLVSLGDIDVHRGANILRVIRWHVAYIDIGPDVVQAIVVKGVNAAASPGEESIMPPAHLAIACALTLPGTSLHPA